jgi:hypothetical protein
VDDRPIAPGPVSKGGGGTAGGSGGQCDSVRTAHPPEWLVEWSQQIGGELKDGLREGPSWIAFARENGTVYHTYTVMAPDPFVAPYYSFLLERTPKAQPEEPRTWRKDEYPD